MSRQSARIVQKLWGYYNVLRDDGLSYQDYLEQLTFLLFLKMAEERAELTGEEQPIPIGYRWSDLSAPQMEGARFEDHYRETLRALGQESGMLGLMRLRPKAHYRYRWRYLSPPPPPARESPGSPPRRSAGSCRRR